MKFAITGATGFVGTALVRRLHDRGDEIVVLSRDGDRARRHFPVTAFPRVTIVSYTPLTAGDWQNAIAGCQGVVNLAGAAIADERWTPERKQEILDSRKLGTQRIVEAIAQADPRPSVLINASAIGYYGTSETAQFEEISPPGQDFLAEVCKAWEAAAEAVTTSGTRCVILRTGIVLGDGGALGKMLLPFRLFAGGPLGTGQQWFSWIHIEDLVTLIVTALDQPTWAGIYNATAPNPVRMGEFCHILGEVMQRPSWLPVPEVALELLLGDAAKVVLEGQCVLPQRLKQANFAYAYPTLKPALASII
jgi:uncharacterized protein (TIGR01777 family)